MSDNIGALSLDMNIVDLVTNLPVYLANVSNFYKLSEWLCLHCATNNRYLTRTCYALFEVFTQMCLTYVINVLLVQWPQPVTDIESE